MEQHEAAAVAAVQAGVDALGLALNTQALGRVAQQWQRLRAVVAELDAQALALHDQPAPTFVPGARPAP
jgi:hypothetical protein